MRESAADANYGDLLRTVGIIIGLMCLALFVVSLAMLNPF